MELLQDLQKAELMPAERAAMEEWFAANPYGKQDENGIDLSLLRENLRLTPTQRLQKLLGAINALWVLRYEGKRRWDA